MKAGSSFARGTLVPRYAGFGSFRMSMPHRSAAPSRVSSTYRMASRRYTILPSGSLMSMNQVFSVHAFIVQP